MPLETSDAAVPAEKPMDIPKELWMMVDHLYRNASQQVGSVYWKHKEFVCTRVEFLKILVIADIADCDQW